MEEYSEAGIKSAIRKGDERAFRHIYEKYYPGMCILASRYTGNAGVAEEIVQDTFLKLWELRHIIQIREDLGSYIYASVRNSTLNYLKHQMVEKKHCSNTETRKNYNYIQTSQEDGSSILIAKELDNHLEKALRSLPPKCRQIFLMHRQEGMKYNEIALKLNLSVNTVQRQISIALEKLRIKLNAHIGA